MWATSEFQLSKHGLEVFDDFGGDYIGIRKVGAVLEAFVFKPKDVELEFMVLNSFRMLNIRCAAHLSSGMRPHYSRKTATSYGSAANA